jgi:hypothetical protein
MQHFDIMEWTDYVRGLSPPGEREAMDRHLSEGCAGCGESVAMLRQVYRLAGQEPAVPADLVRSAKAVFQPRLPGLPSMDWTLLPRLAARLVYSSLHDPAIEGARSSTDALVQVVYHSGDYAIDLQIEPEADSSAMALVGQAVNRKLPGQPLAGVPVCLMARKKLLATTQSNRFGEFCLMSEFQNGLKLCMPIEAIGRHVEIPLDKLLAGMRP